MKIGALAVVGHVGPQHDVDSMTPPHALAALAALGQPHTAVGAREQRDGELVLEPLHMPGQSRLGDVKMSRGAGDAAELGDADEIVKATQLHGIAISRAPAPDVNRNS